jgi:hypothetical protein
MSTTHARLVVRDDAGKPLQVALVSDFTSTTDTVVHIRLERALALAGELNKAVLRRISSASQGNAADVPAKLVRRLQAEYKRNPEMWRSDRGA